MTRLESLLGWLLLSHCPWPSWRRKCLHRLRFRTLKPRRRLPRFSLRWNLNPPPQSPLPAAQVTEDTVLLEVPADFLAEPYVPVEPTPSVQQTEEDPTDPVAFFHGAPASGMTLPLVAFFRKPGHAPCRVSRTGIEYSFLPSIGHK